MTRLNRITLTNSVPILLLSVWIALPSLARADDLTGQAQDDPKDLLPTPAAPTQPTYSGTLFAPMPEWARGITLGPMPDKLKPMGKGTVVASATKPQPLAPPKDATPTPTATTTTAETGAKPANTSDPAMVTVSPFLQWIKANPQAAAAAARQQARSYGPPPSPNAPASPAAANVPSSTDDSYWLPPLIDSSEFGTRTVGGSAAIYSRPQR